MVTQEERRTATQKQILDAAKALFVAHGYEATSTDMILAAARVSRGAMYHHYAAKEEVFAAVFEQASQEAIALMLGRIDRSASPLEQLVQGATAWLRVVRRADLAAILLEQGPQALGWIRARNLESQYSLGIVRGSLKAAITAGQIHVDSVEMTARVLNAALAEAALAQRHGKPRLTLAQAEATIRQLIAGLAITPEAG